MARCVPPGTAEPGRAALCPRVVVLVHSTELGLPGRQTVPNSRIIVQIGNGITVFFIRNFESIDEQRSGISFKI